MTFTVDYTCEDGSYFVRDYDTEATAVERFLHMVSVLTGESMDAGFPHSDLWPLIGHESETESSYGYSANGQDENGHCWCIYISTRCADRD